ncbi:D-arabinono-1,4-lactone oxidase [Streptomyces sp. NPDC058691]|uniref:D-arabinono-1,4-lactone oxidase n=1 Tax=Streptomyces sp. NPDC058691 TaxID=3346601 RepID=UPI00365B9A35
MSAERNWGGNIAFHARRLHTPESVGALQEIVARSERIRPLGTRHSFSTVADTDGDHVSTAALPAVVDIDAGARTATVSSGLRFGEIAGTIDRAGFALHNLGSLPHISVAGACSTGTHGSGTTNACLAGAVSALNMVTADGEQVEVRRGEPDFEGSVVALGALGVVTHLTLDLVPAFSVRQWVYDDMPREELGRSFAEVMSAGYSVSAFTRWQDPLLEQVWLKERVEDPSAPPAPAPREWYGAVLADGPRHPVPGMPAEHCTPQNGDVGAWYERLPHFRMEFTPSSGEEIQSEYFVDRADAPAAFDALWEVREHFASAVQIGEIRSIAADELWLSPAYGRDSVAFHFTWIPDTVAVLPALKAIEQALRPFSARPHWGKLFTTPAADLPGLYPRYDDFRALAARQDPSGTFRNDYLREYFPGH